MRTLRTLAALLVAVAATACSGSAERDAAIRQAAQGYLDAVGNYRFADAAPYASQLTREQTLPTFGRIMQRADTAYTNANQPATITLGGISMVDRHTARIAYHKHTPITEQDDSLTVVREEGRWLAEVELGFVPYLDTPDSLAPRVPKGLTRDSLMRTVNIGRRN